MSILAYLAFMREDTVKLDVSYRKLTTKDLEDVIAYLIEKDWSLRPLNFSHNQVTEIPASLSNLTLFNTLIFLITK